jgi:excisionase family DNA binding protein
MNANLVTPEEAAMRLGISRTGMFNLLKEGRIASLKIGRLRRIPLSAIDTFVESQLVTTQNDHTANV